MEHYEYKTFNEKLSDKKLNKLGKEGWKLINHSAVAMGHNVMQYYVFIKTHSITKLWMELQKENTK